MTSERAVLSVEQAAEQLGCSADTVRERAPELGGLKFGRDWIFPAATFYAVLNTMAGLALAQRRAPPPPRAVLTKLPRRAPPALP